MAVTEAVSNGSDQLEPNGTAPRVLVLGFGALGGLYGFLLAKGGADVYAVARSNAKSLMHDGITIDSDKYGITKGFKPKGVFTSADEVQQAGPFDFIFCTVKNCPEQRLLGDFVKDYLPKNTENRARSALPVVVFIENGINIEKEPYETLIAGADQRASTIISCCAWLGATLKDDGRTVDHGAMDSLEMGLYPAKESNEESETYKWRQSKLEWLSQTMIKGGGAAPVHEDIQPRRYVKAFWNVGFGGLSLCSRQPVYELVVDDNFDYTKTVVHKLMLEVLSVARACGYGEDVLPANSVDKVLDLTLSQAPRFLGADKEGNLRRTFKTSILLDTEQNRPSELTPIFGNLLELARAHGIDCPRIEMVYAACHPALMQAVHAAATATSKSQASAKLR